MYSRKLNPNWLPLAWSCITVRKCNPFQMKALSHLPLSSRSSNSQRSHSSPLYLSLRLHPLPHHQHHFRLRRGPASRSSLLFSPGLSRQNIHLHGESTEHHDHGAAYGSGSGEVSNGTCDPVGCCCLQRSRIQVSRFS